MPSKPVGIWRLAGSASRVGTGILVAPNGEWVGTVSGWKLDFLIREYDRAAVQLVLAAMQGGRGDGG